MLDHTRVVSTVIGESQDGEVWVGGQGLLVSCHCQAPAASCCIILTPNVIRLALRGAKVGLFCIHYMIFILSITDQYAVLYLKDFQRHFFALRFGVDLFVSR